jgi:hypothetical protein
MERLATFSITASAAIAGFLLGIFCAALLGLHEPLHVFLPAAIVSLLAGILTAAALPKRYRRFGIAGRRTISLLGGLLLVGCLTFFWHTIT